jgi:CubicO group peptidase (beta-lactamase class C family)
MPGTSITLQSRQPEVAMRGIRIAAFAGIVAAASLASVRPQPAAPPDARVDGIFASWTQATPGCAVGVGSAGKPVLLRAYGMADLEHDVPNTPDTIFEAGSVSKQFTAAAVLLLAREGKLSLDDPVRKYIPELPDYGAPLAIRHMLTHTSGLRDWGEVEGIAGWPRTSRVYTHAHVLDIVSRQHALNFVPGTNWSYSNTGYNLAAILVSRVSGMPFAQFTRERIFTPLGMTHTSWRDDFTRIVKHRAIAYDPRTTAARGAGDSVSSGLEYRQDMPFENVHGNGGLLTTVGDLLKWNENFVSPMVGDAAFVKEEQTPGRFSDGRAHDYALGLYIRRYRGVPEVSHSGSTAGYRAFLTRYPDQHVSIAVLCNAGNANPTRDAHAVADLFLGDALGAPDPAPRRAAPSTESAPQLSEPQMTAYVGRYNSDEAETVVSIAIQDGQLVMTRRPDAVLRMRPVAADAFAVPTVGTVTFHRDANGRVGELSVKQDRVWDLRFHRVP